MWHESGRKLKKKKRKGKDGEKQSERSKDLQLVFPPPRKKQRSARLSIRAPVEKTQKRAESSRTGGLFRTS